MVISGTGHRPNKLGGYDEKTYQKYYQLAYDWLKEHKPRKVISGMAMGWDIALAEASLDLDIWTTLAFPCKNQNLKWQGWWNIKYEEIMKRADEGQWISEEYTPSCMQKRNIWMVDRADLILALWDGSDGGTGNCIQYANKKNKRIINLFNKYKEL